MRTEIIRQRLLVLNTSQLNALALKTGFCVRTLWAIRSGKRKSTSERVNSELTRRLKHLKPKETT